MKDNVKVRIDLAKLYGAQTVTTKTGQRVVVIPVEANRIYEGEKGTYLDLIAFEHATEYSSHFMKLDLPREVSEKLTPEQRNAMPVVGSIRPLVRTASQPAQGAAVPAWMNAASAPEVAQPQRQPLYEYAAQAPQAPQPAQAPQGSQPAVRTFFSEDANSDLPF